MKSEDDCFSAVMTNLDSVFKSGDITLSTKVHLVKAMVFGWRKRWHPTPVLLPGKFHGRRSLVGCGPWDHKQLDMTEQLHFVLWCILSFLEGVVLRCHPHLYHSHTLPLSCFIFFITLNPLSTIPALDSCMVFLSWQENKLQRNRKFFSFIYFCIPSF